MRLLVALLLALSTSACGEAPDAQGYTWVKDGPSAPAVIYRNVDVYLHCGFDSKARSCAVQGRGDGLCHVYLPKNPEPWMEPHERRHCDGWRHPDPLKW